MKPTHQSLLIVLLLSMFAAPVNAAKTDLDKAQAKIELLEQENQELKAELQTLEQDVSELQQALDNHEVEQLKPNWR